MRLVSAVVPAAGLSTRFGGPNKLLAPFRGGTVVGTTVGVLLACGLDVIVVTGRDADQVAAAVEPARTVFNPGFRDGLGSSLAVGAGFVPPGNGILVALADMPGLRTDVLLRLLAEFDRAPEGTILAAAYSDRPGQVGHPVLFSGCYRDALCGLDGDQGAKRVLQANAGSLRLVEFAGELGDVDTPESLGSI